MRLFSAFFIGLSFPVLAQFNGPESIEHDAAGQRYFVSNTGDNSIKQRSYGGAVTAFASNLTAPPYGIELKGDTLFACMGGNIRGYSTVDGTEVFNIALDATFLNGITGDGHFIYATDFSAKKIFKVDPGAQSYSILVANTVNTPNGIVWDPGMQRLWVVCWGSNAKIKSYDRNTGAALASFTTSLTNLDGIVLDCQGRILVSSWSPGRITQFDNTFTQPAVDLQIPGLSNPADLDFDTVNNALCIPNGGNDSVILEPVAECSSSGIPTVPSYSTFSVHPNPSTGYLTVDLPLSAPAPFLVYNVRGGLVASGTLTPNGVLDISQLARGTYLLELTTERKRATVVRL